MCPQHTLQQARLGPYPTAWYSPLITPSLSIPPVLMLLVLIPIAQFNFLAFHTLAELFSIMVCLVIFALAWYTRDFARNSFLLFLACGYFWIGLLDLTHTLVYKGMEFFIQDEGNLSVQLWVGTRLLEALLLLLAPTLSTRLTSGRLLMLIFGTLASALTLLIFSGNFPDAFIPGQGLTPFKIYAEYLVNALLLVSLWTLFRFGNQLASEEKVLIASAIVLTICAELAFTFYVSVYGFSVLVGHILKILSFWLIFHAVVASNLRKPYIRLQHSQSQFQRLFDHSGIAVCEIDVSGVVEAVEQLREEGVTDLKDYLQYHPSRTSKLINNLRVYRANSATLSLFNAADLQQLAEHARREFQGGSLASLEELLCALWRGENHLSTEVQLQTVEGATLHVIASFQLPDQAADLTSIPLSLIDITEQIRTRDARIQQEQRLQTSESRLRALVDSSPDIIWSVDRHCKILFLNRPWNELKPEQAIGCNSLEFIAASKRKRYQEALDKALKNGKIDQFEWSQFGGRFWQSRIAPIYQDDSVEAVTVISTDITEKRILQAQAIKNARLATLGVLAGGVAHEINNPNSSIQFSNSLLTEAWQDALPILKAHSQAQGPLRLAGLSFDEMEQEIPQLCQRISNNVGRIKTIVDNLKNLVRENPDNEHKPVNLVRVLEDAQSVLTNKIQHYSDHFTLDLPEQTPEVLGNTQQLEQVMINLILNGLQALADRSQAVSVTARTDQETQQVVIEVADQGCGIAESELTHITEPLYSTKQSSGGTGLGLSIAHRIIKQHHGSLEFDSTPGVGTRVILKLPYTTPLEAQ